VLDWDSHHSQQQIVKKESPDKRSKNRIDTAEVSIFIGLLSGELRQRNRKKGMILPVI